MNPRELPIYEIEDALGAALRDGRRAIVRAPTGSGKSTQVPQMLLDRGLLGEGRVVVLQPRRIAARLLAARVARERGATLGGQVGYQVRFDRCAGPDTRILFETEGLLLRQMLGEPGLPGVAAIVFDEFHERHLYGDLTLALALELQERRRPDLRLIVMSATLSVEPLETYLAPCAVLRSEGRRFPVEIAHLAKAPPEREPVWETAAGAFARAAADPDAGDVLVFMPGAYEIGRTVDAIRHTGAGHGRLVLPLHGSLPPAEQDAAVAAYDRPKVIVATNVAETSLTIEGVRTVIDSGLARIPRFDPYRGIDTLLVEKISHASADQRAGRAGRTAPGRCVRLWTERDHAGRALEELPEVRRVDLAESVLLLRALGVSDLGAFRWFDPPEARSLERAETLLRDLGARHPRTGAITPLGRRMLAFPVHPRYARMLMEAGALGCVHAAALAAALTQGRGLLLRRVGRDVQQRREELFGDEAESDFLVLMRAWRYADRCNYDLGRCRRLGIHAQAARQVRPLRDSFLATARGQGLDTGERPASDEALRKCLLVGFSDQLALRADEGTLRCHLVHGRKGQLARESVVRGRPLFVAAEVHEIEGRERQVLLSLATAVERAWLEELFPDDFEEQTAVELERSSRRVVAERRLVFRGLVLERRPREAPPADEAARLLAAAVASGEVPLPRWDHKVEQWILRVNLLAEAWPELGLPRIGEEDRRLMVEQVCLGAVSAKDLKEKPVWPVVRGWLNGAQLPLVDRYAPEQVPMPDGRAAKVVYAADHAPHIAKRIQDLYGLTETPRIADGRVALVVEILGPNFRPVQVTQDLANFWSEAYPRVKKELQRKYPKHEWR